MSSRDDDFLRALRATFALEAAEHLQAMVTGVLALEKSPPAQARRAVVEAIFRAAHSLKGAARAVDYPIIESRCQSLENMFAAWRRQDAMPAQELLDTVHHILDEMAAALAASTALPPPAPLTTESAGASEGTVRIAVSKLDARVLDAQEMLTAKLTANQRAEDVRSLARQFEPWRKAYASVEPHVRALRDAVEHGASGLGSPADAAREQLLDFLEINLRHLDSLHAAVSTLRKEADQDRQVIGKLVDDLLEESKKLLLQPFGRLAASFPKLVRDLCRDQGKEAELMIRGEAVEIDKRILEEMKDPLVHLLRNAVDHGIELPRDRQRSGKPPAATIGLSLSQINGHKVELIVSDDGAGIDLGAVKASAVRRGVLTADEAERLAAADAARLIFEPDVSTSPAVTRVSGRGLGLAIVRERAEKLGGTVAVDSDPGMGTRFAIVLPSTLATFRGILVEAAQRLFVVPTFEVERVARVMHDDIRTVEGRATVALNGRAVVLARLADVLECTPVASTRDDAASLLVMVVGAGDQRVAFAIDAARDEQEVLVKPLRRPLSRVRHISGATVLADGRIALILNVNDLLKSARRHGGAAARVEAAARGEDTRTKSVLVAEDSITSRMLIKGMLESAGYTVRTAVDGMEAFTLLRTQHFDLVVSDVEMPRLNGFDLTARMRADKKLSEVPVVLVTALDTREDRERGVDVGASAYIVKSSFDQSDLLDAVRRLI